MQVLSYEVNEPTVYMQHLPQLRDYKTQFPAPLTSSKSK